MSRPRLQTEYGPGIIGQGALHGLGAPDAERPHALARLYVPDPEQRHGWREFYVYRPSEADPGRKVGFRR